MRGLFFVGSSYRKNVSKVAYEGLIVQHITKKHMR